MRRFQRGLDEITEAVVNHVFGANHYTRGIVKLQAQANQDPDAIEWYRRKLDDGNRAIARLQRLHEEVTRHWSNVKLQRNIGHVEYAPKIEVDKGSTGYTADWGTFVVAAGKVKNAFKVMWSILVRFDLSRISLV